MGSIRVSQIINITQVLLCLFDFADGGLPSFGPAHCDPSGSPWEIKGVLSQRGMRPQSGHRAQYAYHDTSKQQHSGYLETLIYDVDVVKSDAMRTSKNIESIR